MSSSRMSLKLRPGSDADSYAAAVQAQEPDFLIVAVNHAAWNSTVAATDAILAILARVLGLIAAVGVFSTMLLHVRDRSHDIAILKAVGMSPAQLLIRSCSASDTSQIGKRPAQPRTLRR